MKGYGLFLFKEGGELKPIYR